jgi:hypothetical protein
VVPPLDGTAHRLRAEVAPEALGGAVVVVVDDAGGAVVVVLDDVLDVGPGSVVVVPGNWVGSTCAPRGDEAGATDDEAVRAAGEPPSTE